jgi:hypothetical protein
MEDTATTFVRFLLVGDEAGCPAEARGDCHSEAELLRDGTLRLDPWGEPGVAPVTARLEPTDLRETITVLRAPALTALLGRAPVCPEANATEVMRLEDGATTLEARTGHCNSEPVQRARGALIELCTKYVPSRSLVSPPF